ncbi:MAG TPA: YcaO-like family protein [Clostridia bacterium]|nr:YcaO-like family protein [Clostridia bacterium]
MKQDTFSLIKNLSTVLGEIKLVESFERVRQHYDEPKFWYYSASISDKYLKHDGTHFHSKASGVSFFSQNKAVLKALAEAIERYNNFAFFNKDISFTGSYSKLKKDAINPEEFLYFSDKQLRQTKYKKFKIDDKSLFRWTEMKSLNGKEKYLIPCQVIYLSYRPTKREPIIYPSISTGAAGHSNLRSAILSSIYEVLERDAFMIYYLNKLKPKRYDLSSSSSEKIKKLLDIAQRYNLKIISLDINTDLDIPAVASVVIDESGFSKAVSVGLKSHLDTESAIVGSINEAFHTRTWIREAYIQNPKNISETELIKNSTIKNRGLFWYSPKSIPKLDFFINNLDLIRIKPTNVDLSEQNQLQILRKALTDKGYKVYYKDITSKYFRDTPFKVVKVVIPGMQPVYLNEKYPLQGGKRLQSVPGSLGYKNTRKLNTYPHPFL